MDLNFSIEKFLAENLCNFSAASNPIRFAASKNEPLRSFISYLLHFKTFRSSTLIFYPPNINFEFKILMKISYILKNAEFMLKTVLIIT